MKLIMNANRYLKAIIIAISLTNIAQAGWLSDSNDPPKVENSGYWVLIQVDRGGEGHILSPGFNEEDGKLQYFEKKKDCFQYPLKQFIRQKIDNKTVVDMFCSNHIDLEKVYNGEIYKPFNYGNYNIQRGLRVKVRRADGSVGFPIYSYNTKEIANNINNTILKKCEGSSTLNLLNKDYKGAKLLVNNLIKFIYNIEDHGDYAEKVKLDFNEEEYYVRYKTVLDTVPDIKDTGIDFKVKNTVIAVVVDYLSSRNINEIQSTAQDLASKVMTNTMVSEVCQKVDRLYSQYLTKPSKSIDNDVTKIIEFIVIKTKKGFEVSGLNYKYYDDKIEHYKKEITKYEEEMTEIGVSEINISSMKKKYKENVNSRADLKLKYDKLKKKVTHKIESRFAKDKEILTNEVFKRILFLSKKEKWRVISLYLAMISGQNEEYSFDYTKYQHSIDKQDELKTEAVSINADMRNINTSNIYESIDKYIEMIATQVGGGEYQEGRKVFKSDMTGDNKENIIVTYIIEGANGSNSSYANLVIFDYQNNEFKILADKGMRHGEIVKIKNNVVIVKTTEYSFDDARCCPSLEGEFSYTLQENDITERRTKEATKVAE